MADYFIKHVGYYPDSFNASDMGGEYYLEHYGVMGMRWGVRRAINKYHYSDDKLNALKKKKKLNALDKEMESHYLRKKRKYADKIYKDQKHNLYDNDSISALKKKWRTQARLEDDWEGEGHRDRMSEKNRNKTIEKHTWQDIGRGVDVSDRLRKQGYKDSRSNISQSWRSLARDLDSRFIREGNNYQNYEFQKDIDKDRERRKNRR